LLHWILHKAIGHVGLSLVLLTVGVGTADALTGTAGAVGIADHDGAVPRESGEGHASDDENSDQYRDSEVEDDEESDAKRDETIIDIFGWNSRDRLTRG
jgi:hypothetical protein